MGHSPQEIQTAFEAVDQNHLYNRDVLDGPSLLGLGGVRKLIDQMLGEKTFDDLRIPCAVTAVDINAGSEVILSSGRLKDAILATIALPGTFSDPTFGQLGIDRWRRAQPCSCFRGADVVPKPACFAVVLNGQWIKPISSPYLCGIFPPRVKRIARMSCPIWISSCALWISAAAYCLVQI